MLFRGEGQAPMEAATAVSAAERKAAEFEDTVPPPYSESETNGKHADINQPTTAHGMGLTAAASITDANLAAAVLEDKLLINSPTPPASHVPNNFSSSFA